MNPNATYQYIGNISDYQGRWIFVEPSERLGTYLMAPLYPDGSTGIFILQMWSEELEEVKAV